VALGFHRFETTVFFFSVLTYRDLSPKQFFPSPWCPGLHVQLYEPLVLLQTESELQVCVPQAHSSISEKKKKQTKNNEQQQQNNTIYITVTVD